jgi:hypothetical protein
MKILQLPWSCRCRLINTPHLNSHLNCSASCLEDNFSARTTKKTQSLYCCRGVFTTALHSNGSVRHIMLFPYGEKASFTSI